MSGYADYGGRGIMVCDRWRTSFEAFYADMGPRPSPQHSLDRIDNDGNYEPGNCRWATRKEQQRNRRQCHIIEAFGDRCTVTEWAERMGVDPRILFYRIKRMSIEDALTRPVAKIRPKHTLDTPA